ncbi:MAG: hypothetical protein J0L95_10490 [Candidatus Accumulibacter sp.]|uniref:LNS2 domain-containing protein n=1 Tax=Betaproteobacteria TaxID=28216 RepID=UPI001ACEB702|nr:MULTISPECIES: hypothetical protein [Betaproteobacteria]MBN8438457.1 hypothetical protein [Accumulibacter sp.]MBN8473165.1 hypothetical protein [Sulfuritalea sp.]
MPKVIAVDLDGTLAKRTTGSDIGAPIQAMVNRVKQWTDAGREVVIFTARASTQHRQIQAWLQSNDMPMLNVTNIKDNEMMEFWDDKAIRVEPDTGEPCSKCLAANKRNGNHSSNSHTDC